MKKIKDNLKKMILVIVIMCMCGVVFVYFEHQSKSYSDLPDEFYVAESLVVLNSINESEIPKSENLNFEESRENIAKYIQSLYVSNYVKDEINQELDTKGFKEGVTAQDVVSISGNDRIFLIKIFSTDKSKAIAICNVFSAIFVQETNKVLTENELTVDQSAKEETTLFFTNNENAGTITVRDFFIVFLFLSAGCIICFGLLLLDNRIKDNSDIVSQDMHLYLGDMKKGKTSYNKVCLEKVRLFCSNSGDANVLFTTVSCKDDVAIKAMRNVCAELEYDNIVESPGLKDNSEIWASLADCDETILFVNCQKDRLGQVDSIISNYYAAKKKKLVLVFLEK